MWRSTLLGLDRNPSEPDKDFMSPSSPPAPETTGAEDLPATTGEVLESDEAPSPAWLPLVGLGVLFIAMLALLAARPAGTKSAELAGARASAAAEPSADPIATADRARQAAPAQPMPRPTGCAE
jgi:hypothetical protein